MWQAASVRADACQNRLIILSDLSPDESEKICLLAEILGWQARVERLGADEGASEAAARLVLRQVGTVILVEADDQGVREQLARLGLDRLVPPVPLMALEQLLTFAG